ncbi:pseudouridine synthase [soil metagenome]
MSRHSSGEVRLQAYLARAGVASRRASEELIRQGRVRVNGRVVTLLGSKVDPAQDRVEVDGEVVRTEALTWVALHKPRGYVTSRTDAFGRPTIYALLPPRFHSLFHVGRLDRNSEGLLLLSNDGETANRLLHPRYGTTKEYLVDVQGRVEREAIQQLTHGVQLEDGLARAESVDRLHQVDQDVFRIRMVLREGRKREVRRMCEAVGHPVRRLLRQRFGPIELGELPAGRWRIVSPTELGMLRTTRAS